MYNVGDTVKAVNNKPLQGNDYAPALEIDKEYPVLEIVLDSKGNQHLDVGLKSELNYIRSYETEEKLPRGNEIHWCHPSRFVKV
jgi:hypothetical protein